MNFFYLFFISLIFTACPDKDQRCAACKGNQCLFCYYGYLDLAKICQESETKISYCLQYLTNGICQRCQYGYITNNVGQCEKIQIENCLEIEDQNKCRICNNSILAENGKCLQKKCSISNCQICKTVQSQEICDLCDGDKAVKTLLDGKTICVKHEDPNCQFISMYNNDCVLCEINYYMSNGKCLKSEAYDLYSNISKIMIWKKMIKQIFIMFKQSLIKFLSILLEDDKLIDINQFLPQKHLFLWIQKFSDFQYQNLKQENFSWKNTADYLGKNCLELFQCNQIEYDIQKLDKKDQEEQFVFLIQVYIIFIALEEKLYRKVLFQLSQEDKQQLQENFEDLAIDIRIMIKQSAHLQNRDSIFSDMIERLRSFDDKIQELRQKNELLQNSMQDRQEMKDQFEIKKSVLKDQKIKLISENEMLRTQLDQKESQLVMINAQHQNLLKEQNLLEKQYKILSEENSQNLFQLNQNLEKIKHFERQSLNQNRKLNEMQDIIDQNQKLTQRNQELEKCEQNEKKLKQKHNDLKIHFTQLEKDHHQLQQINLKQEKNIEQKQIQLEEIDMLLGQKNKELTEIKFQNKTVNEYNKNLMNLRYLEEKNKAQKPEYKKDKRFSLIPQNDDNQFNQFQ